jgi:hypothetical protein
VPRRRVRSTAKGARVRALARFPDWRLQPKGNWEPSLVANRGANSGGGGGGERGAFGHLWHVWPRGAGGFKGFETPIFQFGSPPSHHPLGGEGKRRPVMLPSS